jgi:superfamily II DNA/RNA helicase
LRTNFDAGIPEDQQSDDYDILVATDAISEGYSLHRAGIIYNYDIPYNPTKVIQRIGRLNRIDKKTYDHIYVYNFFPSGIGEKETRTKAISTLKMQMIHTLLGEDMQVLTPDEDVKSVFYRQYKELLEQEEQESWDTVYRQELENVKQNNPEIFEEAMEIPLRSKIQRGKSFDENGVIIFAQKGGGYKFKFGQGSDPDQQQVLTAEKALSIFKTTRQEKAKQISESFDPIYQSLKQNLFMKKSDTEKARSASDAITQVEYLLQETSSEQDYLKDLLKALRELDGISKSHVREINKINLQETDQALKELKEAIDPHYIQDIITASQKVEEGDEYLILAQEITT